MVLAKYQHMSILELILIIKQHILILCKKNNPCYQVGFCTEIHIHQGNMSSLVGNVVSNKCCLCVQNLLSSVCFFVCTVHCEPFPPPPSQQYKLSWELRKFSLQKKQVLGKLLIFINYCTLLEKGHSGAVDQSRDGMGEVMSSILLKFFFVHTFFSKRCFLTSL